MIAAGEIGGDKAGAARYERAKDDWYVEPGWCGKLLVEAEKWNVYGDHRPDTVWDPACGIGTIPGVMYYFGIRTLGTDIEPGRRGAEFGYDFLRGDLAPEQISEWRSFSRRAIVTNPPYNLAEEFARRAVELAPVVCLLVQAKFLFSQKRWRLFREMPPARLWFLSKRPSMPPGHLLVEGKIQPKGGKVDYLWVVWDQAERGAPTQAGWLKL
jgi:hypothetical protein